MANNIIMTLNEMKEFVAQSNRKEEFDKRSWKINLPHINYQIDCSGIVGMYDFFLRQKEKFEQYSKLPSELERVRTQINNAIDNILSYVHNPSFGSHNLNSSLNFFEDNKSVFLPETPEFKFLIESYLKNEEYYDGAFYFLSGSTNDSSSRDSFIGYLLAYEFFTTGNSITTERKNLEKKSISAIRNEFDKSLSQAQEHLTDYLSETKAKSDENAKSIISFRQEKEAEFYEWYNLTVDSFKKFNEDSSKKMRDFEFLYQEKLKLEAPAQYWSKRATKLKESGNNWLKALVASVAFGIALLTVVLILLTNGELDKIFAKTATAIKWSVVFVTLISFIAFIIRIFSKLTFSSFHLVRDAEEREQLTYVYLALQKEKGIDQTERHLIMQSLFSRADSGLLKDESSPTMPGNIVDKIIQK